MTSIPLALDGYLDAVPTPGDDGTTAQFQLVHSPTDDLTDDTVYACTTIEPHIAHALLTEIQPGDLLRVTGYLTLPGTHGPRLAVDSLELLAPAPAMHLAEMVLDRYGPYVVVFESDHDTVPVFTETGTWVGLAPNPDAITTLITAHETGRRSPDS